ncbi:Retrovirus-related Pol polyprotein from transposon 17.6 [Araneus ventricosus]|uniref:Retrovirus-related Pol polyprotein from transposon 17.6 n=1 Tax=Araneus ventricosus TaxID=182803 RepID=A0A4Y2NY79_ARAVE|nr:Retrovirus-related Pol polyprotein from transposon 17.6 [Araneus ventricosus]
MTGQQTPRNVFTAIVMIKIEGRKVNIELVILQEAKGRRTLLGLDFLQAAGVILDVKNQRWGEFTPYVKHYINTVDNPPAKKELLRKELDVLEKGFIEECESPYAAPVVLVPKRNDTVRLCVDYRKLNANTIPDVYPLPRMDDLFHEAEHSAYVSTIDLKRGYQKVNFHPPHRDKTTFNYPYAIFRFIRMSFGLCNAPAMFQRLMDNFCRGLPEISILVYLDDIIVISDSFEQHLRDLKAVSKRLQQFTVQLEF